MRRSERCSILLINRLTYLLTTAFRLNAMVCFILGNDIFDVGHTKCSRRPHLTRVPQVLQPWSRYLFVMNKHVL